MGSAEEIAIKIKRLLDANRKLKYQVKQLGKQAGRQGDQIYRLRCEIEMMRRMLTVDPGSFRTLTARLKESEHDLDQVVGENRDLKRRLAEAELNG